MSQKDPSQDLSFDELKKLNQKFEQQLTNLSREKAVFQQSSSWWNWLGRLFLYAAILIIGVAAPFVLLVRTSVFVYVNYNLHGWLALLSGILATIVLLLGYVLFLSIRYQKKWVVNKYTRRAIAVLVVAYTLYGLLYFSEMNTKTNEIRDYYRSLHPIMRVAVSTVTLADSDIVITDIQRTPQDYQKMGLAENQQSLHYVQSDGYVHAVDLRTKGRAEWKNWLMQINLHMVGLQTLRHHGTANHLHVSLPLNDS